MRAVGYIRVSLPDQVDGHSLEAQTHSIRTLCASRNWTLVHIYSDAGISARHESHRPDFEQMLQDARADRFDILIVDKLDRFYRNLRGCLASLDLLHSYDVSLVSVRENLDFSTPWGKLTLTVLGMLAEIYIDNLREETRKGKLQRARKGLHNGSAPFGYCRGNCSTCTDPNGQDYCPRYGDPDRGDGAVLVPHPIESVAVELAFDWYLTGDFSDGVIAERLNDYEHVISDENADANTIHFRSKGLPGRFPPGRLSKDAVRHILQRPFYTGVVPYYGKDKDGTKRKRDNPASLFPGQHDPLISMEDYQAAQDLRDQLSHRTRHKTTGKPAVFPLSGLITCASCGRPMRAASSSSYRYYRDVTHIEHLGECDQPTLRAEEIEEQVVDFLRSLSQNLPDDWRTRVIDELIPPEQRTKLEEREREVNTRIERATRLYLEGHIEHDRFLEEKRHAQAVMADLHPAQVDVIMEVGAIVEAFDQHWEEALEPLQQNGLLRKALAGVQVQGYELTAVQANLAFYPLARLCRSGSDGDLSLSSNEEFFFIHPAHPIKHYLTDILDESQP